MEIVEKNWMRLVIAHELCNGCGLCETICSLRHEGYVNKECSRIKISGRVRPFPLLCLQCEQPVCLDNCPVSAIERSAGAGLLTVDYDRCITCRCCVISCPFGGTHENCTGRMIRCDLCGGNPECAEYCPTGALTVSLTGDAAGQKRRRFALNRLQPLASPILKPSMLNRGESHDET